MASSHPGTRAAASSISRTARAKRAIATKSTGRCDETIARHDAVAGARGRSLATFVDRFRRWANATSCAFGSPWALGVALAAVLAWALCGPYFGFSPAWQMVINTGTTIVTFLMAFLIQATQFRESEALHLKIDELLRAVQGARTGFVNVNDLPERALQDLSDELRELGSAEEISPVRDSSAQVKDIANRLDDVIATPSRARRRGKAKRSSQ